jgi:hypothetical protein
MARLGLAVAAAAALLVALTAAPAAGSEYSKSLAKRVEREVVYVDPKARPKVSVAEAGDVRLRILDKAMGRIKIAVVPERRAEEEGGVSGLAAAMGRDLDFRGTLMVVAGNRSFTLTSHPASDATAKAVQEAFERREDDSRGKQLLASVDAIAAVDPGPSADAGGTPPPSGIGDFNDETEDIFDTVNDAFRITTIIIALSFILPILALVLWIVWRVRKSRKEAEGDIDFEQEGLRNQRAGGRRRHARREHARGGRLRGGGAAVRPGELRARALRAEHALHRRGQGGTDRGPAPHQRREGQARGHADPVGPSVPGA